MVFKSSSEVNIPNPMPNSLREMLLDYFDTNRHEALSRVDIRIKFDAHKSTVLNCVQKMERYGELEFRDGLYWKPSPWKKAA